MLYLGVDGGGTKTAFTVIDHQGVVVSEHQSTTCYYIQSSINSTYNILKQGVHDTLVKAGLNINDLSYSFFGLPAYGEDSKLTATLDSLPNGFIPSGKFKCDNDMVNGWAAGFGCNDGINIIAGTGSIAYGRVGNRQARGGGWGELFSDEGSAYWIGIEGLKAFSKMSDGRLEAGPLLTEMRSVLSVKTDLDVSALVHSEWKGDRTSIAQVARIISKAATLGDKTSIDIFQRAGLELAQIIHAVASSLNCAKNDQISVSYSGGVFESGELILNPFLTNLKASGSEFTLQPPIYSPVVGAAHYAKHLHKLL